MNAPAELTPSAELPAYMEAVGRRARAAAAAVARASTAQKNAALAAIAASIRAASAAIVEVNRRDLERATAAGLAGPLLDRLRLTAAGVEKMAAGVEKVADLPDPIGEVTDLRPQPVDHPAPEDAGDRANANQRNTSSLNSHATPGKPEIREPNKPR